MNKLTLFLAALALFAGSSDSQAQKARSRDSLTVVPARGGSNTRVATSARTGSARASKPVVVENAQARSPVARASRAAGGVGVVRDLTDRPIVGAAGASRPAYPGGTIGTGPISPTKPSVRPYSPTAAFPSPAYAAPYSTAYNPTYYATGSGYSPYYYASGYGYSPYYTGSYYPGTTYSSYYDYYDPFTYSAAYSPPYTGSAYYPASSYSVSGLTGVGVYPAATYPEPIQTNVTDWTPPVAAESYRAPAAPRRTQQKQMIEYEQTMEYEQTIEK